MTVIMMLVIIRIKVFTINGALNFCKEKPIKSIEMPYILQINTSLTDKKTLLLLKKPSEQSNVIKQPNPIKTLERIIIFR